MAQMSGDSLEKYIDWADGCVCVYSVLDEDSFRHIDTLYLMVKKVKVSFGAESKAHWSRNQDQRNVYVL